MSTQPPTEAATAAAIAKSYPNRAYTLTMLVVVFTSSHVDRQIMGILAEPIKIDLGLSDAQVGLMTGFTFALFYATLGMPIAMWADRGNRRNIIALAVTIWSATTALCAFAQNFAQMLIARVGVGVGEAGSNPPSHSIIADLYAPHERATAMAIFGTGINFGVLLGFLIGGWVNEWYGWRNAFLIVGLPGLLIAGVVYLTVREPPRGLSERLEAPATKDSAPSSPTTADSGPAGAKGVPFLSVLKTMMSNPVLRHFVAGCTLCAFVGYASIIWVPVYFIRVHELGTGEVGTMMALIVGLAGAIGTLAAGRLADKLGGAWQGWVVALALLIGQPVALLLYLSETANMAWIGALAPAMLGAMYVGPTFAVVQSQMPVHMRAVAAAILLFIINIIGLGLGPYFVGAISDLLHDQYAELSLRYALVTLIGFHVWSALHYLRGGQLLGRQNNAAYG